MGYEQELFGKNMKNLLISLLLFGISATSALGSMYSYPDNKRPAVTLADACKIATYLLSTQGDEKRFYVTSVSLYGSKEQDGWGAWNLYHHDKDGNKVNVFIQFPTGKVGLHYYPHDYSKNEGDRKVAFDKSALQILAEQGGTGQPATRPKSKSKSKSKSERSDKPQPEAEGRSR